MHGQTTLKLTTLDSDLQDFFPMSEIRLLT